MLLGAGCWSRWGWLRLRGVVLRHHGLHGLHVLHTLVRCWVEVLPLNWHVLIALHFLALQIKSYCISCCSFC